MANLEVRVRPEYVLPTDGLPIGDIPLKLEIVQQITKLLQDIGGELFGVDLSHEDLELTYALAEDGSRVFLDVCMFTGNVK